MNRGFANKSLYVSFNGYVLSIFEKNGWGGDEGKPITQPQLPVPIDAYLS